MISSSYIT